MVYQVTVDENNYLTAASKGGLLDSGLDISEELYLSIEEEKLLAYRLSEDFSTLSFDMERWERLKAQAEETPPSAEERIAGLEAALNLLLKGGSV